MKLVISKTQILSAIAYCGVNQHTYKFIDDLNIVITKMNDIINKEFQKCEDFYCNTFEPFTLHNWLHEKLMSIEEFKLWSLLNIDLDFYIRKIYETIIKLHN